MNSMTGFGRCEIVRDGRLLEMEIKTVNHRFLDLSIRTPRFMGCHEQELRDVLKSYLRRGHVEVFVRYASERDDATKAILDTAQVQAYADAAKQISQMLDIENDLSVSNILAVPDILSCEPSESEIEAIGVLLVEAARKACEQVVSARENEGLRLWEDIEGRLDKLWEITNVIEKKEPVLVAEYQLRLSERLKELMDSLPVDETRVAQEVAIFADRANVTEEITRIRAHLTQLRELSDAEGAQGRNMDFIVQELNREFNTIGSKSQDTDVTRAALDGKAEVEKIREQVQNIE